VVSLDVPDCAVELGTSPQRPVNDEQIVPELVLSAEGERELHLGLSEVLLQRERELVEPPAACQPGGVASVPGDDIGRLGSGGEHAPPDAQAGNARRAVTAHKPGRE